MVQRPITWVLFEFADKIYVLDACLASLLYQVLVHGDLLGNEVVHVDVQDLKAWILTKGCSLAALEGYAEGVILALHRILQLEKFLLIIPEVLKHNDLMVPLYQRIVPVRPPVVAVLATWGDVADNPNFLGVGLS